MLSLEKYVASDEMVYNNIYCMFHTWAAIYTIQVPYYCLRMFLYAQSYFAMTQYVFATVLCVHLSFGRTLPEKRGRRTF